MNKLTILRNRLEKIGINVAFVGNYPWIYLYTINGIRVKETFNAEHGWTIAFSPIRQGQELQFTDIKELFKEFVVEAQNLVKKCKNTDDAFYIGMDLF